MMYPSEAPAYKEHVAGTNHILYKKNVAGTCCSNMRPLKGISIHEGTVSFQQDHAIFSCLCADCEFVPATCFSVPALQKCLPSNKHADGP